MNIDPATVASFGDEWKRHRQDDLSPSERQDLFDAYFDIFPWDRLKSNAVGFDMGVGSGRWAQLVAPRVGKLHAIDASQEALKVAQENLVDFKNVTFHQATTDGVPLGLESCDFGYSIGVLHHIPDTESAMTDCIRLLKPGALFLVYLYYSFDNRPIWFRRVWKASEVARSILKRMPPPLKNAGTDLLAGAIYWPLAQLAAIVERLGCKFDNVPLAYYRDKSFATMRTDSRDRFGTPLEQRFTRAEIREMMERCGMIDVHFSQKPPFWVAVGVKR